MPRAARPAARGAPRPGPSTVRTGQPDRQVTQVAAYLQALREQGRRAREFLCAPTVAALREGLPIRVGPGATPRIILRGETAVELGNPEAGSCAFLVWTDTPSLITDGRITLIGPDIQEAHGHSLPFAQVLLLGGTGLADAYQSLAQTQYVADQIEGYMVRSASQHIWSRISHAAAAQGFCFEVLGRALMILFKSAVAAIQRMEVLFVTSSKDDVLGLTGIAAEVRAAGREIVKEHWKARGYDLDCDLDCRACGDKKTCGVIRDVLAARRRIARRVPA